VDWWALGCMVYEFLVGFTPFYGESCEDIFENILNYRVEWPPTTEEEPEGGISPQALDFVKALLTIDPEKRLGAGGAKEVKSHPWFADINWDTLLHQEALFVPKFEDINDTSYFDRKYW
jgi:serine/threonine-protein kinase RIM15